MFKIPNNRIFKHDTNDRDLAESQTELVNFQAEVSDVQARALNNQQETLDRLDQTAQAQLAALKRLVYLNKLSLERSNTSSDSFTSWLDGLGSAYSANTGAVEVKMTNENEKTEKDKELEKLRKEVEELREQLQTVPEKGRSWIDSILKKKK